MDLAAGLITAAVMGVGVLIAATFVTRDLRSTRAHRQALISAIGAGADTGGWMQVTHGPRPWRLSVQQRRSQAEQVELVMPAQVAQTLAVHRLDLLDRTAAGVGLIQRRSTGDAAFDRLFAALSDGHAAPALLADARTRAELLSLLGAGLQSFIWSAEDQAVVVRWDSDHVAANDAATAARVVALVGAVTAAPAGAADRQATGAPKAGRVGNAMIGALVLATSMLGFGGFAAIALDHAYPPLDRTPFLHAASAIAAAATVLWAWVSWRARGRQPADHRAWLPMLVLAGVGSWIVAYAAAVGINGAAAQGEPVVARGRVVEKLRVPRGGTADHALRTTTGTFAVPFSVYREAEVGDRVRVTTNPGRLGVPWRDPDKDIVVKPAR